MAKIEIEQNFGIDDSIRILNDMVTEQDSMDKALAVSDGITALEMIKQIASFNGWLELFRRWEPNDRLQF